MDLLYIMSAIFCVCEYIYIYLYRVYIESSSCSIIDILPSFCSCVGLTKKWSICDSRWNAFIIIIHHFLVSSSLYILV